MVGRRAHQTTMFCSLRQFSGRVFEYALHRLLKVSTTRGDSGELGCTAANEALMAPYVLTATWIPVISAVTHPSMPHCPPPPQCDPTDGVLVAPLEPGIADVGLVFLERAPAAVTPAVLAAPGTLGRPEGARTVIVGYGTTTPRRASDLPLDTSAWDGERRVRFSAVRRIVDETWGLWSIPSDVCSGDSGAGIFSSVGSSPTSAMEAGTAAATTTTASTRARFSTG